MGALIYFIYVYAEDNGVDGIQQAALERSTEKRKVSERAWPAITCMVNTECIGTCMLLCLCKLEDIMSMVLFAVAVNESKQKWRGDRSDPFGFAGPSGGAGRRGAAIPPRLEAQHTGSPSSSAGLFSPSSSIPRRRKWQRLPPRFFSFFFFCQQTKTKQQRWRDRGNNHMRFLGMPPLPPI